MKIQPKNQIVTSERSQAPTKAYAQDQSTADVDTVELGTRTESFESDISRLYDQYRNSNSRSDQNRLKNQLQLTLESGPTKSAGAIGSLLKRLFAKNESAWRNKEQSAGPAPSSDVEFNLRKFKIASGQPLTGDNLFHADRMQRIKNLAPLASPEQGLSGDARRRIDDDLNLLGSERLGNPRKKIEHDLDLLTSPKMGNPKRKIEDDLNLLGSAPKLKAPGSERHVLNRLV